MLLDSKNPFAETQKVQSERGWEKNGAEEAAAKETCLASQPFISAKVVFVRLSPSCIIRESLFGIGEAGGGLCSSTA